MKFSGTQSYVATDDLKLAVNAAITLERPLLVKGEPGTGKTMLAEQLEYDPLVIEAQLAHSVRDANGRAYNRTTYLKQRQNMMQHWADYLDKLADGVEIIPLQRKAA